MLAGSRLLTRGARERRLVSLALRSGLHPRGSAVVQGQGGLCSAGAAGTLCPARVASRLRSGFSCGALSACRWSLVFGYAHRIVFCFAHRHLCYSCRS